VCYSIVLADFERSIFGSLRRCLIVGGGGVVLVVVDVERSRALCAGKYY
jgi:hypothetical protein